MQRVVAAGKVSAGQEIDGERACAVLTGGKGVIRKGGAKARARFLRPRRSARPRFTSGTFNVAQARGVERPEEEQSDLGAVLLILEAPRCGATTEGA